jgi:hypothetical protein
MDTDQKPPDRGDIPPQPTLIQKPEPVNPAPAAPATEQQLQRAEQAIEDRMSGFERSMVRLTRAGVIVAAVTLIIFCGQLWEMHSGGSQTDKIIAADERIAIAMENAVGQAKLSLDTTVDQFHLEQRAWLGVQKFNSSIITGALDVPYIEADRDIRFIAQVVNSGKTVAMNTKADIAFQFLPNGTPLIPRFGQAKPPPVVSALVIQPGATVFMQSLPTKFSANQIAAAAQSALVLYIYGRIHYRDVFGKQHLTEFCSYLTPDLRSFNACATYNTAD